MKKLAPEITDYYNGVVIKRISEKYGYAPMEAMRLFIFSKTHELLENAETGMTAFGAEAVFEIWEVEKITGDPRNSVYIIED